MEARDLILSPELSEFEVESFLRRFGIQEPEAADRNIRHLLDLTQAPERLAGFLEVLLESASASVDPDAALTHFAHYLEAVPSALNLLSFLQEDPRAADLLIGILGASPFLSQILIRNPEYLYWMAESNRAERIRERSYFFEEAAKSVRPFETLNDSMNALRRFKRRESLRIGAQDLLGLSTMTQTVSQVSSLADSVLETTFQVLARERFGGSISGFLVVALGKLGGEELNFSSDIDLLFLYEDDAHQREMLKFAREYSRLLGEHSPEGHLYRIDLRLRPMGGRGEIAYSEKAVRHYYQTWADTMDRLALIKCRPVAGDLELGRRFLKTAHNFVFKSFQDYAAVEEIHWLKRKTDEEIRKKGETGRNIKLGLGGIREIEFFVQAIQLLYGGLRPEIRTTGSLAGLNRLLDSGFLSREDHEALTSAYCFLRNLEHKLQLVHDLQTHSLPEEERELIKCARRMGYKGETDSRPLLDRFRADLEQHNRRVRRIFDSLFEDKVEERGLGRIALDPHLSDEEALGILSDSGARNAEEILEGIRMLQQAPSFPQSPARMRNLLANLIPILVEMSTDLPSPRDLFTRLDRFAENLGSRSSLYTELVENRSFARELLTILGSSEFLSETLIRHPEYLDLVTRAGAVTAEPFFEPSPEEITNLPRFMEAIRRFKQHEEFRIGVAEISSPGEIAHRAALSRAADSILRTLLARLAEDADLNESAFCLVGLGKLGGCELTFHSDLDLLFILDEEACSRNAAEFEPVIKKFRGILTSYTANGRAYEVDFRLRPEGTRSMEIVTRTQLIKYFKTRIEAWERLAYTKNRIIFASPSFTDNDLLNRLLYRLRFSPQDVEVIRKIRTRKEIEIGREEAREMYDFKVGFGSLLDIQFIVQYLQIQHNVIGSNTLTILNKLCDNNVLKQAESELLQEALRFYYALESMTGLLVGGKERTLARSGRENDFLAVRLGYASGSELLDRYLTLRQQVRSIFDEVFEADSAK